MTGFGKVTAELPSKKVTVEIKALNSKQLDLSTRIPSIYKDKEMELRSLLLQSLERGKVEFNIFIEYIGKDTPTQINLAAVENYYNQIKEIAEKLNISVPNDWFQTLLRMPDAIKSETVEPDESEWGVVLETVKDAIKHLCDFRIQEGAMLQKLFEQKIANIATLLKEVEKYEGERIEKIKARIMDNLQKIAEKDYDKNRFEQEMIYYIEKLDVNEEKNRLDNHLKYFISTMESGHGQGKKLGFIAQEMGREINTLGSKSNHAEMQKIVVQMKDELEQIKEQVLLTRMAGKLIIFSAPSGSGKSTIINYLLKQDLHLRFSISATSRAPRGTEKNGVEYYFLTPEEFRSRIANGDFLEYEEVYTDKYYGTLKSEVERILNEGDNVIFDVDVVGGCNIKKFYGDRALSVFIQPPCIDDLRKRLEGRGTDSPEVIESRIAKAEYELGFTGQFDKVVVNDDLETAQKDALKIIREFLNK